MLCSTLAQPAEWATAVLGALPLAEVRVFARGEAPSAAEVGGGVLEVGGKKGVREQRPQLASSPRAQAGSAPGHARLNAWPAVWGSTSEPHHGAHTYT